MLVTLYLSFDVSLTVLTNDKTTRNFPTVGYKVLKMKYFPGSRNL